VTYLHIENTTPFLQHGATGEPGHEGEEVQLPPELPARSPHGHVGRRENGVGAQRAGQGRAQRLQGGGGGASDKRIPLGRPRRRPQGTWGDVEGRRPDAQGPEGAEDPPHDAPDAEEADPGGRRGARLRGAQRTLRPPVRRPIGRNGRIIEVAPSVGDPAASAGSLFKDHKTISCMMALVQ